jgi:hypothetical protein
MKKKLEEMTVEDILACDEFQTAMAELVDYE